MTNPPKALELGHALWLTAGYQAHTQYVEFGSRLGGVDSTIARLCRIIGRTFGLFSSVFRFLVELVAVCSGKLWGPKCIQRVHTARYPGGWLVSMLADYQNATVFLLLQARPGPSNRGQSWSLLITIWSSYTTFLGRSATFLAYFWG